MSLDKLYSGPNDQQPTTNDQQPTTNDQRPTINDIATVLINIHGTVKKN